MIFHAISDLHLTSLTPRCRKDDYLETQFRKLEWILKTVFESENKILVIGGDVFDRAKERYFITKRFVELLLRYNINLVSIPGQHDLLYHVKGIENTPLGIIKLISQNNNTDIKFIEQGWEEEVTEPGDVLVTHQMVIENKELYPGQENYISGRNLLRKHPDFKVIVSGDNHKSFFIKTENQLLVNCGSVFRSNKDQMDHKPLLWEINISDLTTTPLEIPIEQDVFNKELIEQDKVKKENKELDAFIQSLPVQENVPNFNVILKSVINTKSPKKEVHDKINQIMEVANG